MVDYREFSRQIKEKYPEYKEVDDLKLANAMIEKYPEYERQVDFGSPLEGKVTFNDELKKYGKEQLEKRKQWEENHPIISDIQQNFQPGYRSQVPQWEEWAEYGAKAPIGESLKNTAKSYALETIPAVNTALSIGTGGGGAGKTLLQIAGSRAKEGALLGSTAAGLDEIGDNGLSLKAPINAAKGAVAGMIANPIIGGIVGGSRTLTNKIINSEPFKNSIGKGLEVLTSVPKKYIDRALNAELKGNSIFKGKFDKDTAYIPIERELNTAINRLPEKEYYAKLYSNLANKAKTGIDKKLLEKNQELNAIIKNMPENADDISGLRASIDEGLDKFRFGDVNPALEEAGGVINNAKRQLGFRNNDEIQQALQNYSNDFKTSAGINGLDKEKEDIAFNILAQATGKNKNWLKSQLKAELPKMSTQKRQEFIQNLLEQTDDKIENIDPTWAQTFPEINWNNLQNNIDGGETVARNMFDRIIGKNYTNDFVEPIDAITNELNKGYSTILDKLIKNPTAEGYARALNELDGLTNQFGDKNITDAYFEKFMNDWDNISNIVNPRVKPATLHGVKEQLYDRANFSGENFGNYGNSGIKSVAQDINEYLRNLNPEYARINDELRLLNSAKFDIGGPQGINQNTFATKLKNIGSEGNTLSNMDYRLSSLDKLIDPEYRFFNDAKQLVETQAKQNEMLKLIGADQKMRNPRLLDNITDEKRLNALDELQRMTGTNFMDRLETIRAREALERLFPGQGGGSGSDQGFGNLLRQAMIGGASVGGAFAAHNPLALLGVTAISPKLMAKGTIQNLGRLNRLNNMQVPSSLYNLIIQNLGLGLTGN